LEGWRAIDTAEPKRGVDASRPRVKFVDIHDIHDTLAAAEG
jgi:hypothetical protein